MAAATTAATAAAVSVAAAVKGVPLGSLIGKKTSTYSVGAAAAAAHYAVIEA